MITNTPNSNNIHNHLSDKVSTIITNFFFFFVYSYILILSLNLSHSISFAHLVQEKSIKHLYWRKVQQNNTTKYKTRQIILHILLLLFFSKLTDSEWRWMNGEFIWKENISCRCCCSCFLFFHALLISICVSIFSFSLFHFWIYLKWLFFIDAFSLFMTN